MKEIEDTFIEEYEGAQEQLEKKRFKNAAILFSKSLFAVCDLLIHNRFNKLPNNHTERFRLLEEYFPETYNIVDTIFNHYTDAYSKPILKATCEEIKDGIKKVINHNKVQERIKEATK